MNPKSADMKRATGVTRRTGSTNWQWAIKPPKDLKDQFPGQWAHRCSLDTADLLQANAKAAKLHLDWHQRFEDLRRVLNPVAVAVITPDLGMTLGGRIRALILAGDDRIRDNPVYAEFCLAFVDGLRATGLRHLMLGSEEPALGPFPAEIAALRVRSPLDGLTTAQASRLAQVNGEMDSVAGRQLAARQLSAVLPMADTEARKMGLLIDWKAPEARPVLMDCLKASRAAFTDLVQRDQSNS